MANIQSIADFKAGKKRKLTILQVYVYKRLDESSYIIADLSDHAKLSVVTKPEFGKAIALGTFIKLVNPSLENGTIIPGHMPLQAGPIQYKKLEEEDLGNLPKEKLRTFDEIGKLAVKSNVPEVVSKVTFLSPKKPSPYSGQFRTAGVKDCKGQRHAIQLFGSHSDSVEMGKVYKFENLTVGNFKGPMDNWNRLGTSGRTSITEASNEIANDFSEIEDGDGKFEGIVLGHEKPYLYHSCPKCGKKCEEKDAFCGQAACRSELTETVHDFNVTLHIQECSKEEKIQKVFCFRSQLEITLESHSKEELTTKLENLNYKVCQVQYRKSHQSQDESLKAIKIKFNS